MNTSLIQQIHDYNDEIMHIETEHAINEIEILEPRGACTYKKAINILRHAYLNSVKRAKLTPTPKIEEARHALFYAHALGEPTVGDFYSSSPATQYGIRSAFALDFTVLDDEGEPWDFVNPHNKQKASDLVTRLKPTLLIWTPMCNAFSIIHPLNRAQMGEGRWRELQEWERRHMKFALELFELQLQQGGYILHEHPGTATSWRIQEMVDFMGKPKLEKTTAHQCMYGQIAYDDDNNINPVKKSLRASWLTQSTLPVH